MQNRKINQIAVSICGNKSRDFKTNKALQVMTKKALKAFRNLSPEIQKAMCVPPHLASMVINGNKGI